MKYFVGCSGWRYGSWVSGFYPVTLHPRDYLAYYSRIFDLVAVSVRPAQTNKFKMWAQETSDDFRFLVRIPKQTTECEQLGQFLEMLTPIKEKILAVVLQVQSELKLSEDIAWLGAVLGICTHHGYSVAVEFANSTSLPKAGDAILRRQGATAMWSDHYLDPVVTSDFVSLHLSGSKDEAWIGKIEEQAEQEPLKFACITVDNPHRVNKILKMLGLPERKYHYPIPAPLSGNVPWSGRVVMCVDLNAFYPSCEELREPALIGSPHAVIMTDQKDRVTKGVVSSCSYEARRFGVRSAMPLARALSLCPDLVLRPVDIMYYQRVSETVMDVLAPFADVVEQASIDEAFLDCTKSAATDPHGHAARIKAAIRQQCGLRVSIGIATSKSIAKIASDFEKPDGLTVIHPSHIDKFLAPLEVGRIPGIGPKTKQRLKKIGIETIGQLAASDVQRLTDMFGSNGIWMWRVARGSDDESVQPREEHVSLSTEHTLDEPTKDQEKMLGYLSDLVDEIHDRIVRNGYMFRTVGVKIVRTDFAIESRETSFDDLQTNRESISSVLEQLLNRFAFDDSLHAVRKVGLRVTNLVSEHKQRNQVRMQKTMLDYMSMLDMPSLDI